MGLTPCLIESDVVDDVAAIARQFLAADLFRCGGARLRELPGHTTHLHDGKLRRIGQHHRHLKDDAKRVADVVGMELREGYGAIAALQIGKASCREKGWTNV